MRQVRPVSMAGLVTELAESIDACRPGRWTRVVVDGAPPARPDELADALVDPLRLRGRPVARVSARDFLRPASLRFEHGRTDPDAFYQDWLDLSALTREVLEPLGAAGSGRFLPSLWDADADRATRAAYQQLPDGGVLLVDGTLLLGRGLSVDFSVHLLLSSAALTRQLPDTEHWTLPAYARYAESAAPAERADMVVRMDHPDRPAVLRGPGHPRVRS